MDTYIWGEIVKLCFNCKALFYVYKTHCIRGIKLSRPLELSYPSKLIVPHSNSSH